MPSQTFLPAVHFRRLPPLFCLSFGALCSLLITGFVHFQRFEQKNDQLLHDYGAAVASVTAFQSVDAAVAGDLLGLRAQLQAVAVQPRVRSAAVLDADGNLLVEAGDAFDAEQQYSVVSPILVDQRTIGQIRVGMEADFPGDGALFWTFWGISGLLMLAAALSLFDARGDAWYFRDKEEGGADEVEADLKLPDGFQDDTAWPYTGLADDATNREAGMPDAAVQDTEAQAEVHEGDLVALHNQAVSEDAGPVSAGTHSDLIIFLPNRRRLQQQLCKDGYGRLMTQYNRIFSAVLALYDGECISSDDDYFCVRFGGQGEITEATYQAICAAFLIRHLNQHQKFKLEVLAQICATDCDVKLAMSDRGIYLQGSLINDSLAERLETSDAGDGRVQVVGLRSPYHSTVQNHQSRLLKAIA